MNSRTETESFNNDLAAGKDMPSPEPPRRSVLERLLNIVTEVEGGEGPTAIMMSFNLFLLLAAYYVLKPVREALVTTEWANTGTAIMALLLIPTVKAYGAVARKVTRKRLISYATAFFIANLVMFYVAAELRFRWVGALFFIWVGIFNNMVVAQFWSYGNDIYEPEQGKRLFPLILLGSSIGAILGPVAAATLAGFLGTNPLLLVAAVMLAACIRITVWIDNHQRERAPKEMPTKETLGTEGGFELVLKHRYLLCIALLIVVLNVVNTTGEQIRRETFNEHARLSALQVNPGLEGRDLEEAIKTRKLRLNADFFFWVNLLTFLLQSLVVSRILGLLGVGGALALVPLVVALGYGMMSILPTFWVVRSVKIAENSQDYSLMNTLRAALYLPTTRDMKYKAKQAIDTFFVRLGDLIAAGTWFVGMHHFGLTLQGFARLMLALIALWLALAMTIFRERRRLVLAEGNPRPAIVASS